MAKALVEDHSKDVLLKLSALRDNETLCDIILVSDEGMTRIAAHRCILAANSEYFNIMFAGSFSETKEAEVIIDQMPSSILQQLIEYSYTSELEVNDTNIVDLFEAASYLQMHTLLNFLTSYTLINLNISNCWVYRLLADRLQNTSLHQAAETFICHHFIEASHLPGFLKLTVEQLIAYLESGDVNISSEETLLYALIKWIRHDTSSREQFLPTLFTLVDMKQMSPEFLAKHLEPLCTMTETKQFLLSIFKSFSSPHELTPPAHCGRIRSSRLIGVRQIGISMERIEVTEFNYESRKWNVFAELFKKIACHYGVAHCNGFLYFAVGYSHAPVLSEVLEFNVTKKIWKTITTLPMNLLFPQIAALNGMVYIFGEERGQTKVKRLNPVSQKWSEVAILPGGGGCDALTTLDGRLYISRHLKSQLVVYDPPNDECSFITLKTFRNAFSKCLVGDGDDLIFMGGGTNEMERYNLKTKQTEVINVNLSRDKRCCVRLQDKLVAFSRWGDVIETADKRTWTPSQTIEPYHGIFGVFAIPSKYFNETQAGH